MEQEGGIMVPVRYVELIDNVLYFRISKAISL
jgi:hypothetical protein